MPPTDKRFRMRLGNHHLLVTTTLLGVEVEYFTRAGQADGDWKVWLDYADNPDLEGLRHPVLGWDLVGLARLFWAYVGAAGNGKVSTRSHLESGINQHRESTETRSLIRSVLQKSKRPLSRKDIAETIGKSKHSRLNNLIEQMVKDGEIIKTEAKLQNGKSKYLYSIMKIPPV